MLDEMFLRNASKFTIFLEYQNPGSLFHFSFRATLFFPLMNALVYVNIGQFIREKIMKLKMKSIPQNMATLEAFRWNISSNTNLLFLKSVYCVPNCKIILINILFFYINNTFTNIRIHIIRQQFL